MPTNSSNRSTAYTPSIESHRIQKLGSALEGEILTGEFDRGRYATDASIYQMMPLGVVVPKSMDDVKKSLQFAIEQDISILPRGGGTSQCGQTVNHSLIIDQSKHLNKLIDLDIENFRCRVQPGIVLDELNRILKPYDLWFPVDVSTASRATIGGMAANNSCGTRSIRYGLMRDNVISIDNLLADGSAFHTGEINTQTNSQTHITDSLLELGSREQEEIKTRFPKVMRRVGGYNIDALIPEQPINLSHLLVGSEGTLAFMEVIELKLSPLPQHKLLGVCHFPSFYGAMDAAQHIVKLDPVAVELIDRTMIELSMGIPMYRDVVKQFVHGEPEAILLVEFSENDPAENKRRLKELSETMKELGFDWSNSPNQRGGVVEAINPTFQSAIFEVRKAGLNIMMSMKDQRKPISFVEDCAVQLEDLAEYTGRLTEIFHKHNTTGTWYAHASVGCLHVRPILNTRLDQDIKAMRAIAEEAFDMVLEYKGSHSGEHGDGIVRSEFHEKMFGSRMVKNFREVKQLFDPKSVFNPGKIIDPLKMDDSSLFRYSPEYKIQSLSSALDWSDWPGEGGGFQGAVEMCNNNGACRKLQGGVMCPSYRVTLNEKDLTRGRANSLRLAISGQLGSDAVSSDAMQETMKLCVGCKACKSECPTGVDMARMKIEVDSARYQKKGLNLHQKLIAFLPSYAPFLTRIPWLINLRNKSSLLAHALEKITGFSKQRQLPIWRRDIYRHKNYGNKQAAPVVLFADTFNTYFESENLIAAQKVLAHAGYYVQSPTNRSMSRPLCCGRTWLTNGMVDRARTEMTRLVDTLYPFAQQGIPIVGLEPSCTLSLRDELPSLLNNPRAKKVAEQVMLFEEFIASEKPNLSLKPIAKKALLHGHCHQKSYGQMSSVQQVLKMIPKLTIETIETSCCGMAGSFGYNKDTWEVSVKMAELKLLPAIASAESDTLIVADGTSCRHQIDLNSDRKAIHVARVLEMALAE